MPDLTPESFAALAGRCAGVPHRGGVTEATPPAARVPVPDLGTFLLLVAGGLGAGLSGTMAGLASLFSYPALLAAGLPAVAANVTNTVALTVTSVGAAAGLAPGAHRPVADRPAVRHAHRGRRRPGGGAAAHHAAGGVREGGAGAGRRAPAAVLLFQPQIRAAVLRRAGEDADRGGSARARRDPRRRRLRRLLRRRGRGDAAGVAARRAAGLAAAGQRDQERAARACRTRSRPSGSPSSRPSTGGRCCRWPSGRSWARGSGPWWPATCPRTALRVGIALAGLGLAVVLAVGAW